MKKQHKTVPLTDEKITTEKQPVNLILNPKNEEEEGYSQDFNCRLGDIV